MISPTLVNLGYLIASVLFIMGLKMLSRQKTARMGNRLSAVAMLLAVVTALLSQEMGYTYIIAGFVIGGLIGTVAASRVQLTAMPELVALFNGFGGVASLLVGWAEYEDARWIWVQQAPTLITLLGTFLAVLIGGVTFTGSLVAYAKLAQKLPGRPLGIRGQQIINAVFLAAALAAGVAFMLNPVGMYPAFLALVGLSLVFGVLFTLPSGGADMPVAISLLNSCSGLAACAAGFVIDNTVLIVAGALVGASGLVLTMIMCKAMNRSLRNVLFGAFGGGGGKGEGAERGQENPIDADAASYVLEAADSVVVVPGYGMAVAQAQHAVRELAELLAENGTSVTFGVHPVAGRMPGHMNVLLAEANVPYDQLLEMDDVNAQMSNTDVAIVIGANDVVNPAARDDADSTIYGMPIINVDHARTVFVLKRSMASGFAGIDNPLFYKDNTRMLFGDAKASIEALIAELKEN